MKMHMSFVALLVIALGVIGLTGCDKNKDKEAKAKEHPTAKEHPAAAEAAEKEHPTAKEHPAAAKPKDHPAH